MGSHTLHFKYTLIISEKAERIDYEDERRLGGGGGGYANKMGYIYIDIINQYNAHGLSSFIALLISFVWYFKIVIHYFQFVNFTHLFQPSYSPSEDPAKLNIHWKPIGLPTKCSIELLVYKIKMHIFPDTQRYKICILFLYQAKYIRLKYDTVPFLMDFFKFGEISTTVFIKGKTDLKRDILKKCNIVKTCF